MKLTARRRVGTGKGAGRRIRSNGLIPAVLYGNKGEAVNLALEPKAVREVLSSPKGQNQIVSIEVVGGESVAYAHIVDFQKHPVKRTLVHCDLQRVDESATRLYTVPIRLEGRSMAEKTGGRIVFVTRRTRVRCKPTDVPEAITVDVSPLEIGESIRIADLKTDPALVLVYSDNYPVATGAGALVEIEDKPAEAAAAEGAEPAEEEKEKKK